MDAAREIEPCVATAPNSVFNGKKHVPHSDTPNMSLRSSVHYSFRDFSVGIYNVITFSYSIILIILPPSLCFPLFLPFVTVVPLLVENSWAVMLQFAFEVKCFDIKTSFFPPLPSTPFQICFLLSLHPPVVLQLFRQNGMLQWLTSHSDNVVFNRMLYPWWQTDWLAKSTRLTPSPPSLPLKHSYSPLLECIVNTICGTDEIHVIAWNVIYCGPCWRQMNRPGLAFMCIKFHCTH